jgi:hypothetical protein
MTVTAIIGLIAILAVSIIPLSATTVISFRTWRRGWWLGLPWAIFGGLWLAGSLLFTRPGWGVEDSNTMANVALAAFVGGWAAVIISLIVLASVGPKIPTVKIQDIF